MACNVQDWLRRGCADREQLRREFALAIEEGSCLAKPPRSAVSRKVKNGKAAR